MKVKSRFEKMCIFEVASLAEFKNSEAYFMAA